MYKRQVIGVALVGTVLASGAIEATAGKALTLPAAAMVVGALASLVLASGRQRAIADMPE